MKRKLFGRISGAAGSGDVGVGAMGSGAGESLAQVLPPAGAFGGLAGTVTGPRDWLHNPWREYACLVKQWFN